MTKKYPLSMTGAAAYSTTMPKLAELYLESKNWETVRKYIIFDNPLLLNSEQSRQRVALELIKRLRRLSNDETAFLMSATGDDRYTIEWLAICRTYPFVESLSEELIAKRYAKMIPDLTYNSYDVFFETEAEIHPELHSLTQSTREKMRSRIFRMLKECRLLSEENRITPLYPSDNCVELIKASDPDDLKIFPRVGALS